MMVMMMMMVTAIAIAIATASLNTAADSLQLPEKLGTRHGIVRSFGDYFPTVLLFVAEIILPNVWGDLLPRRSSNLTVAVVDEMETFRKEG